MLLFIPIPERVKKVIRQAIDQKVVYPLSRSVTHTSQCQCQDSSSSSSSSSSSAGMIRDFWIDECRTFIVEDSRSNIDQEVGYESIELMIRKDGHYENARFEYHDGQFESKSILSSTGCGTTWHFNADLVSKELATYLSSDLASRFRGVCPWHVYCGHGKHHSEPNDNINLCLADFSKRCVECGQHGCASNTRFSGLRSCGEDGIGCGQWICFACCQHSDESGGKALCSTCRPRWIQSQLPDHVFFLHRTSTEDDDQKWPTYTVSDFLDRVRDPNMGGEEMIQDLWKMIWGFLDRGPMYYLLFQIFHHSPRPMCVISFYEGETLDHSLQQFLIQHPEFEEERVILCHRFCRLQRSQILWGSSFKDSTIVIESIILPDGQRSSMFLPTAKTKTKKRKIIQRVNDGAKKE